MTTSSLKNAGGSMMNMGGPSLSSNVANLGGDSTQAFVDCVLLYAKNLEADAVSVELQVR
jgi:hypothetical protein